MNQIRLSRGEQILGGAAVLLLLLSFIPLWAKYSTPGVKINVPGGDIPGTAQRFNLWNGTVWTFFAKLALILTVLLVLFIAARAAGLLANVQMPVPVGLVYLGGAGLVLLLMLLVLLIGPDEGFFGVNFASAGIEVSRGPLVYVGVLLAIAMAAGGWLHFQEGETTTAGPPPPGPPPPPPGT